MWIHVFLLGFIPTGALCASRLNYLLSHVKEVSAITSSNIFSGPFSLLLGTPIMQMLVHLMLSQRSSKLSSFLFTFFPLYSVFQQWFLPTLSSRSFSLICFSASVILLLVPSSVFLNFSLFSSSSRSWETFLASSSFFFWDPGSPLFSLFWIIFLKVGLFPLHLIVFLGFYLVALSGT